MGALRDGWFQGRGIQEDGALAADQLETGLEAGKFGGELAGGWQTQAEMQKIAGSHGPIPEQPITNRCKPTARVKKQPSVEEGLRD
jgi:hypothetical protein